MKRKKRLPGIILISVSIICTILFVPWNAVRLWATPLPDTVQEQVDNAIDLGLDGIVVYVEKKDSAPKYYSAGWKNRDAKTPADPHALFKIASISKLYIAAAAAKLVASDSLALDKTLAAYLPELADRIENADKITLRMMIQHRSGIPEYIYDPNFPWADLPIDPNEILKLALDKPADFKPGSRYKYCNTNYLLIGRILDNTLGYSHRRYIKERILDKLGLTHTYGLLSEVKDTSDMMSGYTIEYDGDLKMQNFVTPGGSMVATAEDVGTFLRALNDGSLLSDKEQTVYSSIYVYDHTGLLPGYSSIARYYKDIDTVVITFVNTSGGQTWGIVESVSNRISRILHK